MTTSTQITNCHRNIMGTVSFTGKFPGMRKSQEFIVYPMQDSGETIKVQSDNRMGQIDLGSGQVVLSESTKGHSGMQWLSFCIAKGTASLFELPVEDVQTLRQWVKSTGGILVGSSIVKSDNTGAMAL